MKREEKLGEQKKLCSLTGSNSFDLRLADNNKQNTLALISLSFTRRPIYFVFWGDNYKHQEWSDLQFNLTWFTVFKIQDDGNLTLDQCHGDGFSSWSADSSHQIRDSKTAVPENAKLKK